VNSSYRHTIHGTYCNRGQ